MALVDMRDMLRHAHENNYAVGAFDLVSLDFLEAVVDAAEKSRAAIILSVEESHFAHYDFELMMSAVETAARRATVPVAIQLDHGRSRESAIRAIGLGCNGVMYDASDLDLPENVEATRTVVELVHQCGVMVVGELGQVNDVADEAHSGDGAFTVPAEAAAYVERTGVDCLAVSIGTVRGKLKGRTKLDFQRLKQLRHIIDIPMEIHGGSGLVEEQFRKLTALGVAKINYYTALSELAARIMREHSRKNAFNSFTDLKKGVREAICEDVQRCLRLWGSAGRAAEVLAQCKLWNGMKVIILQEHLGDIDEKQKAVLLKKSKDLIEGIPGVREVYLGESVDADARYSYFWSINLTHPVAADSLREHPNYATFEKEILKPSGRVVETMCLSAAVDD